MADNDFAIEVDSNGKSVIVEFWVQKVAADWWLTELKGQKTIEVFRGSTIDNTPDAVPFKPQSLDTSITLGWNVVLFGPQQNMDVKVTVDVRQDGKLLGQKQQTISLTAKKATQVAGTISLVKS